MIILRVPYQIPELDADAGDLIIFDHNDYEQPVVVIRPRCQRSIPDFLRHLPHLAPAELPPTLARGGVREVPV